MAPLDSDWAIAVGESKEFSARSIGGLVADEVLWLRHLDKLRSAGSKPGDIELPLVHKEAS
jgi:hypothetical protein